MARERGNKSVHKVMRIGLSCLSDSRVITFGFVEQFEHNEQCVHSWDVVEDEYGALRKDGQP